MNDTQAKRKGHTPGPWQVDDSNLPDPALLVLDEGRIIVASVEHRSTYDEAVDNASVIAAAPTMYEAIERAIAWHTEPDGERPCTYGEMIEGLIAAKRAAEGGAA